VNDGSTDHTREVLQRYRQAHEFIVIEQENRGLPAALNAGFARARGKYLTWTSSDNIMLPRMLEVLARELDGDPSVSVVYADRILIDAHGKELGRLNTREFDRFLIFHANLVHCCFLFRRECMERVGMYDPEYLYSEDWEFWIRVSEHFAMKRIPEVLYRYRLHPTSMTSDMVRQNGGVRRRSKMLSETRKRMPIRWWIGKIKCWSHIFMPVKNSLRYEQAMWQRMLRRAAEDSMKILFLSGIDHF
jgi:glycosyltransferase involved in cell wall biosynthesis